MINFFKLIKTLWSLAQKYQLDLNGDTLYINSNQKVMDIFNLKNYKLYITDEIKNIMH